MKILENGVTLCMLKNVLILNSTKYVYDTRDSRIVHVLCTQSYIRAVHMLLTLLEV